MKKYQAEAATVAAISGRIKPHLAGHAPEIQGVVLADLVALHIAGYHPTLREPMLDGLYMLIEELIPINEKELFGEQGFPMGGLS